MTKSNVTSIKGHRAPVIKVTEGLYDDLSKAFYGSVEELGREFCVFAICSRTEDKEAVAA